MLHLLNQSMTVFQPSGISDGMGNQTIIYYPIASGVPCRLRELGGGLVKTNEKQEIIYDARIFCEPRRDLEDNYRLDISGSLFDVKFIVTAYGRADAHHMRIDAKRV